MRTFVAVELDEAVRRRLSSAIGRLRSAARDVKWVDAAAAHLTLKFIGELDPKDLPAAIAALRAAAGRGAPFTMRVRGVGAFPPHGRPRVIHAPVEEPGCVLAGLAAAVEEELFQAVGTAKEGRAFAPHVTLGRVRTGRCPPAGELARSVPDADFGEVKVTKIVLMESDLTPRGPVYTALEHIPLGGEE